MAEIERFAGRAVAPERVLAIGDGLPTDVLGANRMGLDCLFVTSGIHAADTQGSDGRPDPVRLAAFLASKGASARYAMADLAWAG
jgi:ribonucleotide monophosphatase NagD (HAD superfamily)